MRERLQPPLKRHPVDSALRTASKSANKGRLWLALAVTGVLAGGRSRRAAIRGVGALAATSLIVNVGFKPFIRRERPDIALTPVARRLRLQPWTTSFPSGHAASAAAFTTGVALESPAAAAVVAPLGAAVAYSRVHVGVHHVSDVVVGAAIGAGVAVATQRWWPLRRPRSGTMEDLAAPALPRGEGLVLVANERAGSGDSAGDTVLEALPQAVLLEFGPDTDIAAELDGRTGVRALGAVGGDGTVNLVAGIAAARGLPLAVFPAGTHNHFAQDLGIVDLLDAAPAVEHGSATRADTATAGGRIYVNTACIGAYPEMVRVRDELAVRYGSWLATALATARTLRAHQPVDVVVDGVPARVWTLFVGNCRYTPRGPYPAHRRSLDDGVLDVQYLRAGRYARIRAIAAALAGIVDHVPAYRAREATSLHVRSSNGPVEFALDGETGQRAEEIEFAKGDPITVYGPAPARRPGSAVGGVSQPRWRSA